MNSSLFSSIPEVPEDPMFGLSAAVRADSYRDKVDLGVGAYRGENARPWILPSVKKAEEKIQRQIDYDHEYLPIAGDAAFLDASAKLVFGEGSVALTQGRVASVQTLSGTGALHLGACLLAQFLAGPKKIYMSSPPYANHKPIFNHVGIDAEKYPYYEHSNNGLDLQGMLEAFEAIPRGSLILLHACAHNPTGVDPSQLQWKAISKKMQQKHHIPFFDLAYQGFATGDADTDVEAIRMFVNARFDTMLVAQSYAKNFGLYGERTGCLHVLTPNGQTAQRVFGQLKIIQRREVSTPPLYGARIVSTILNDRELIEQWKRDCKTMAQRIRKMRTRLRSLLEEGDAKPGGWRQLTDQVGMFCYSGLTRTQVSKLRNDHHIYLTNDGRINVSGLNDSNVERTARAILLVTGKKAKL